MEKKKEWNEEIDPETIPVEVLVSQVGRIPYEALASARGKRNEALRQKRSGPVYWAKHNPATSRCRCKRCMAGRERVRAEGK